MSRGAPSSRDCSRPARWPEPECTAPTGWRPTACSRAMVVGRRAGRGGGAHAGTRAPVIAAAPGRAADTALRRKDLQRIMTVHASVVRDADGLTRLAQDLQAAPPRAGLSGADTEDIAPPMTARAAGAGALARGERRW